MSDETLEPLYVDSRADQRSRAILQALATSRAINLSLEELNKIFADWEYEGDGSIVRPFSTLDEARNVQKPGQPIIVSAYGTISQAFAARQEPVSGT